MFTECSSAGEVAGEEVRQRWRMSRSRAAQSVQGMEYRSGKKSLRRSPPF